MEYKAFETDFQIKDEGSDDMTFEGYASTFGNVDEGNDVIVEGAFKRTIKNRFKRGKGTLIKVLRGHWNIIGIPIHMEEDSTGLLTVSKIASTDLGKETMMLIKDGVLDRLSIGYKAIKPELDEETEIRTLKEIKLYEYSVVDFPMNEQAVITGTKALEFMKDSNVIQMLEHLADSKIDDALKKLRKSLVKEFDKSTHVAGMKNTKVPIPVNNKHNESKLQNAIIALRSTATALEDLTNEKDSPQGTPKKTDYGFDPAILDSMLLDMKDTLKTLSN